MATATLTSEGAPDLVVVHFVGDLSFARKIAENIRVCEQEVFSAAARQVLTACDVLCGNLESPIVKKASVREKGGFCGPERAISHLTIFTVLSLANNHALDCGQAGLEETIELLDAAGIAHTGITTAGSEDFGRVSLTVRGQRLSIFGCTTREAVEVDRPPGLCRCFIEDERFRAAVHAEAELGATVVVLFHGGDEFMGEPSPALQHQLRTLHQDGACVIVTQHPHVLGGPELTDGSGLTWFSLGDFLFDGQTASRRHSAILRTRLRKGRMVQYDIVPTLISDEYCVEIAPPEIAEKVTKRTRDVARRLQRPLTRYTYVPRYLWAVSTYQLQRIAVIAKKDGVAGFCRFALTRFQYLQAYGRTILRVVLR